MVIKEPIIVQKSQQISGAENFNRSPVEEQGSVRKIFHRLKAERDFGRRAIAAYAMKTSYQQWDGQDQFESDDLPNRNGMKLLQLFAMP